MENISLRGKLSNGRLFKMKNGGLFCHLCVFLEPTTFYEQVSVNGMFSVDRESDDGYYTE